MNPTRLFDILEYQKSHYPQADALAVKKDGQWISYSTDDIINIVNRLAIGLYRKGISKGDKVAIISENRPEWNFADLAIQKLGAISVPMYTTITEENYRFIFEDASVKMVFVSSKDLYEKVQRSIEGLGGIQDIITFDKLDGLPYWADLKQEVGQAELEIIDTLQSEVDPEDLVTLIYTSGTTGNPKGVMLTHTNVLSNSLAVSAIFPFKDSHQMKTLSFLPLSHIFERTASYFYQYSGISVYYAESLEKVGDNIREVKPDMFASVPRMLEKVYERILNKGRELTGIKKSLFFWAMSVGEQYKPEKEQGYFYNKKLAIANKLIFSKWREALGGNVRLVISGGAALQPRLATIFCAAGIPIREAYGLTETSPGITFNRIENKDMRIGTVGPTLPGISIKIAEDGEVLCKGPNVMKGYYKRQDLTDEVIDKEGWFHTGDIGEIVEGRFLKIVDRKKEMFKTSGGKYISPQMMENKFKESPFIEQIVVIGESKKFPAALIVPSFDYLKNWCELHGIPFGSNSQVIIMRQVIDRLDKEIEKYNDTFAQYERVKKFVLLPELFSIEKNELTAKMSLRRKVIEKNYEAEINEMYKD